VKSKTIIFSVALFLIQTASAATLLLSGTVPDRGVILNGNNATPQENSELKVYIQQHVVRRGPQSEGIVNNESKKWNQLNGTQTLASSSIIKVVAP
jgi:hypothetical protein